MGAGTPALGVARERPGHRSPPRPANPDAPPVLTRREAAVLQLLSQDQTNREIGAAPHISPSTAGVHVSNILRKLGCRRRVDAAAQAHKFGLTSSG
jgi:DNA-binding NarL/FixJ family response regulator